MFIVGPSFPSLPLLNEMVSISELYNRLHVLSLVQWSATNLPGVLVHTLVESHLLIPNKISFVVVKRKLAERLLLDVYKMRMLYFCEIKSRFPRPGGVYSFILF